MTCMIRLVLHDGAKHRVKIALAPSDPDGYALSPIVKTAVSTFAALSSLTRLSTIAAVASSPSEPHKAMSPTPIITAAPASATSLAGASAGGGGCVGRPCS